MSRKRQSGRKAAVPFLIAFDRRMYQSLERAAKKFGITKVAVLRQAFVLWKELDYGRGGENKDGGKP